MFAVQGRQMVIRTGWEPVRVFHVPSRNLLYNSGVPKKKPEGKRQFNVGEQVRVKLRTGETVDATVKAVVSKGKGIRLQVDYGKDQTAVIYDWQVLTDSA
jgi:hypothetical protein